MPYVYNTPDDQRQMLQAIGASSIEELFAVIPEEMRISGRLDMPPALTEMELDAHMKRLASENQHAGEAVCFLGAGSYDHFIPAAVDAIASRSEFYTSYTPYQPEVSQGNLQATFEYQTLVARLTGMDVSNASVYDGASAAAEAVLMAISTTSRPGHIVTAGSVHPEYRQTIATYLRHLGKDIVTVATPDGTLRADSLAQAVDDQTACVLIQQPNFFGAIEDVETAAQIAHDAGALLIVIFDPISLGLLRSPGDCGADIAVAEGQTLGTPMSYGGPYLGIMACKKKLVRRMPGRIVGQTVDRHGRRCFTLTLQTREQHIRREKATSNICTNQGLFALRAAVYAALMGPEGLRGVAELCLHKACYAAEQIAATERFSLAFDGPTWREFVVRDSQGRVDDVLTQLRSEGILGGVPLGRWYPELDDCFLVAVTEKRTKEQIDALVRALSQQSATVVAPA